MPETFRALILPPFQPSLFAKRVILGVLLISQSLALNQSLAQVPSDSASAENDVERALEGQLGDTRDANILAEFLTGLAENPMDINKASAVELQQIPAIDIFLAQRIVSYRNDNGAFSSITALIKVSGFTDEILATVRPYLTIRPNNGTTKSTPFYSGVPSLRQITAGMSFEVIQRVTRRLDLSRGYNDDSSKSSFLGTPERVYTRFHAYFDHRVSLNLTMEKDPGEPFEWNPSTDTYGFDHVSMHFALRDFWRIRQLIVGDYEASFGQGLVLWRNFATGKGQQPIRPVVRSGSGFRPYASTEENRFFRGIAATVLLSPNISFSPFYSRRKLDASFVDSDSLFDSSTSSGNNITSFSSGGLHRTSSELLKKDNLGETLVGSNAEVRFGTTTIGFLAYQSRFDRMIRPDDHPSRLFTFSGDRAHMVSLYGTGSAHDIMVFGEIARAPGNSWGIVTGLEAKVSAGIDAVFSVRSYPRNFVSLHGFAFGERNGATQNETGYYLGLRLNPSSRWKFNAYFDQYRFPWVRLGIPLPSSGYEAFVLIRHQPHKWLSIEIQGRSETRDDGVQIFDPGNRLVDALQRQTRQSLRFQFDYDFSSALRLRSRIEGVSFFGRTVRTQHGIMIYQDIRWQLSEPIRLNARLTIFDTDSFQARVFVFENDLRYTFSLPSLSGRGQRSYFMISVMPKRRIQFQLKYVSTRYEDVNTIGSGINLTDGNHIREVKVQFIAKF